LYALVDFVCPNELLCTLINCDFYQNIYTPADGIGNRILVNNCIENFLGPEICGNPVVTNSKLTLTEQQTFDSELSLQELDRALNKLNENSAGGLDGIPTRFIKKFWAFLRVPLHLYAGHAFRTGRLTQSFISAGIRLIPKKGDVSQIKNWRPISLLNSIFKIISKAIDMRLQKITDIVLSRGQKGFTNKRQLHECLINIVENIAFVENENIPSFLLALDMAKAFDTVRHDYMTHVYRFFGLGENFINMLNVISTGRTAHIIKEDGSTSPPIILGTGFPQGNSPSPNQFNIGEQILIFKIELDANIRAIKNNNLGILRPFRFQADGPVPAPFPVQGPGPGPAQALQPPDPERRIYGEKENNRNTEKVEAFADDNNIMALLDNNGIKAIKIILNNFAILSGLKCNVEKSQILVIGTDEIPDFIRTSGFSVANEIKILGFTVTRDFADFEKNIDCAVEKIKKIAAFWSRFKLSLPGRINVAKSLMLSQINFHGAVLNISNEKILKIQGLINSFVTGSFKFDKDLINCTPSRGGLGMINVKNYIQSLHCSWIKKAYGATIDNWRLDVVRYAGKSCSMVQPFVDQRHPILSTLLNSFREFKKAFYLSNKNFMQAKLGGNPCFTENRQNKTPVNIDDRFDFLPDPEIERLKNLRFSDLTNDGNRFISKQEFEVLSNIQMTNPQFRILTDAVKTSFMIYKKFVRGDNSQCIDNFISRFKKGSNKFRKVFDNMDYFHISKKSKKRSKTFFRLIGVADPEENVCEILNAQWAINCYPVNLREFSFKLRNNILGINTRVSHFNNNVDRACTFCRITERNNVQLPDESFIHIFFECKSTKRVLDIFFTQYLDWDILDRNGMKRLLFTGMDPEMSTPNFFLLTVMTTVLFYVWQCKLQKKVPTLESLLNDLFFTAENILKASNIMVNDMNLNLPLCRNWEAEASRRRF
jgi:hypothetical protein